MKCVGKTHKGWVKESNEDFLFISDGPVGVFDELLIVADGMGGLQYGEIASETTVEAAGRYIAGSVMDNPYQILSKATQEANLAVRKKKDELHSKMMGSTLVIVGILGEKAYIVNVGDSRAYLLNDVANSIRPITKDHSYVAEMVERGLMTRYSKAYEKSKNVITRAVGLFAEVIPDCFEETLNSHEKILVCSDGLTDLVKDSEIRNIVLNPDFDENEKVNELVKLALERGGTDNISVGLFSPEDDYD